MPQQSATRADGVVEHLLSELEPRIEATFAYFGVPPHDAEDLLQDSLLAFVAKSESIRSPDLWLLQTIRNNCASYWRRRRRWIFQELDEALRDEPAAGSVNHENWRCELKGAISRLPERCRSLLHLRYALGYQTAEMADRLGYREGSVRKAEMRCLSALTREITEPETVRSEA